MTHPVSAPLSRFLLLTALLVCVVQPAWAGKTLESVKQRGQLVCGVNTGLAGFGAADSQGKWTGMDVDICRAVAQQRWGMPAKYVTFPFLPLSASPPCNRVKSMCYPATPPSR